MTPEQAYENLEKLYGCFLEDNCNDDSDCGHCPYYVINPLELIQTAKSIIGQMRWTPVTETLPPSDEWVLATVKYPDGRTSVHRLTCVKTFTTLWEDETMNNYPVTAWQKLPEPWDGNTENKI